MKQYQTALIIVAFIALGFLMGFTANKPKTVITTGEEIPEVMMRSYQIQLDGSSDKIVVYDGYRYVGTLKYTGKSQLDKLVDADNY